MTKKFNQTWRNATEQSWKEQNETERQGTSLNGVQKKLNGIKHEGTRLNEVQKSRIIQPSIEFLLWDMILALPRSSRCLPLPPPTLTGINLYRLYNPTINWIFDCGIQFWLYHGPSVSPLCLLLPPTHPYDYQFILIIQPPIKFMIGEQPRMGWYLTKPVTKELKIMN